MIKTTKSQNWLLVLLTINLASTIFHYTDNFVYFERYPAPNWMNMHHVYLAWLILTPFAVIGYFLYKKHQYWLAYLCLFIYSNAGAGSMGHYFYGSFRDISFKMNASIAILNEMRNFYYLLPTTYYLKTNQCSFMNQIGLLYWYRRSCWNSFRFVFVLVSIY